MSREQYQSEIENLYAKNTLILQRWDKLKPLIDEQNNLKYTVIQSVSFRQNILKFNEDATREIPLRDMSDLFSDDVRYFFYGELPQFGYIDLSEMIAKFEMLFDISGYGW